MVDTQAQAREIAANFLAAEIQAGSQHDLVITDVSEFEHCWVATYNTRRWADTRQTRYALAGNGPLIVNRRTGVVRRGVAARPVEEQLDEE